MTLLALTLGGSALLGLGHKPYLAPVSAAPSTANLGIDLGPEEDGLPSGAAANYFGFKEFPDGHISLQHGGSQLRLWLARTCRSYLVQGSSFNDLQPFSADGQAPTAVLAPSGPLDANSCPTPIECPNGITDTTRLDPDFDRTYAAFGSVVQTATPGVLIGVYHAEHKCGPTQQDAITYASVALAISHDNGFTWEKKGQILTGQPVKPPCKDRAVIAGAGEPSTLVIGQYIYVYYTNWTACVPDAIQVARATLDSHGNVGAWHKYNGTGFSLNPNGIGGSGSPVISGISTYAANASISFNTELAQYLAIFESNGGIYYMTSSNAITWGNRRSLLTFPQLQFPAVSGNVWYSYPTLLSADKVSDRETGNAGYLFYARGIRAFQPGSDRKGELHHIIRRAFTVRDPKLTSVRLEPPKTADEWRPLSSRRWICIGDISVRRSDGSVLTLYDNLADTGLIVVIERDADVVVVAPYGTSCSVAEGTPASPDFDRTVFIDQAVAQILRGGCGSFCRSVRVVELDVVGNIARDRWFPESQWLN